jgi:hypothetical protein
MAFVMDNSFAARVCGIKPVNTPKRTYQGDTETVSFMGFDLTAELDSDGTVEGLVSPDGSDCYCAFQEWAIADIEKLVEKKRKQSQFDAQYDKGEDRYNDRMAA